MGKVLETPRAGKSAIPDFSTESEGGGRSSFRSASSFSYGVRAMQCVELPGSEDAHGCAAVFPSPEPSHHGPSADSSLTPSLSRGGGAAWLPRSLHGLQMYTL